MPPDLQYAGLRRGACFQDILAGGSEDRSPKEEVILRSSRVGGFLCSLLGFRVVFRGTRNKVADRETGSCPDPPSGRPFESLRSRHCHGVVGNAKRQPESTAVQNPSRGSVRLDANFLVAALEDWYPHTLNIRSTTLNPSLTHVPTFWASLYLSSEAVCLAIMNPHPQAPKPKHTGDRAYLVAEWIHFTLFGIILPTTKLKVYTFGGL